MFRRISSLTILLALVLATSSGAQIPDRIGIFFDTPFESASTNINPQLGSAFPAYVVVLNASFATLCGYEVGVTTTEPQLFVISLTGPNGWLNFGDQYNQIAAYGTPLPTDPCGTVLATYQLLTVSANSSEFIMGEPTPASIPGFPAIWDGDGCMDFTACSLTSELPIPGVVATLNGAGVSVGPCDGYNGPIWHVATTGSDVTGDGSAAHPFASLRRATDAASAGHIVEVHDGTYSGVDNRDIDLGDKYLTIRSQSGAPASCVFDLGGVDGIEFSAAVDGPLIGPEIEGITFRNGNHALQFLGEDWDWEAVTTRVENCRFEDNIYGADLTLCSAEVSDCHFSGNTNRGFYLIYSYLAMNDCHFEQNGLGLNYSGDINDGHGSSFENCDFENNGVGADFGFDGGYFSIRSCRFESNTDYGFIVSGADPSNVSIIDVVSSYNGGAGFLSENLIDVYVNGGALVGNGGHGYDHGSVLNYLFDGVVITDNGGWGIGYSTVPYNYSSTRLTGCEIRDNLIGGAQCYNDRVTIDQCVAAGNGGPGFQIRRVNGASTLAATLTGTTMAGNAGPGFWSDMDTISIAQCIIAFNTGIAAELDGELSVTVTCTDIHANAGGDWTVFPGMEDVDGNFSAPPLFCDLGGGDCHLTDVSPCAPGNHPAGDECGLIGALPVGCQAAPVIQAVADVPDDQGLQVRVIWDASHLDSPVVTNPVVAYGVYRWDGGRNREHVKSADGRIIGWDYLESVPARGDAGYQYVAPTLCDSTAAGICWSVFFISAETADPFTYYDSAPDSGYSMDNIVPPAPATFTVAYGPENLLSWEESDAPDIARYEIYRSEDPDFEPGPETLVHQTQETVWYDADGAWGQYYYLAAIDDAGNTSEPVMPDQLVAAPSAVPERTTLVGNYPNPFNPRTTIVYTLAADERVTLQIFDLAGRAVRMLVAGAMQPAGRYEIDWLGRDDGGRGVATGTYFCRLTTGVGMETQKMVLVR